MAGIAEQAAWPLPTYSFVVSLTGEGDDFQFDELSGFEPADALARLEISQGTPLTLRRGVLLKGNKFLQWFIQIKMGIIQRQDLHVRVLDESGTQAATWRVVNAFPTKVSGTDLGAEEENVAIDALEISHEGITVIS